MLTSETRPDNFTFACLSRAFSDRFDVAGLRVVHGGLIVSGLGLDSIASSALVTAYSKVGLVDDAGRVFAGMIEPDLVLWNSMISGYGSYGDWDKGMRLFATMRRVGKQPDGYTMVGLISGLTDPSLLGIARGIHGFCYKIGLDSNAHVGTVLVSMYSKCKCLTSAYRVFDDLSHPDLVTWSALITGFSRSGDNEKALRFFHRMNTGGRKADSVLIASALAATAQLAIVRPGIEIHGYAVRHYFDWEVIVSSALVDMYSKCGFMGLGIKVFKNMPQRNIVSYNSVIACFGLYGCASEAFEMFRGMLEEGLKPDETTFSALLCACCHAGLVKEGWAIFRRMEDEFGIIPKVEHYIHLVKLLGMEGELEEAYDLIITLPEPIDSGIWGALLSCCDVHKNSKLAEFVAQRIFDNKIEKNTYKVMLSNLYACGGRWDEVKQMREDMVGKGNMKLPGVSWIES